MTSEECDHVTRVAKELQATGNLLAWAIDEPGDRADFFVPLDADAELFPDRIGSVRVFLTWLPRAEEFLAWRGSSR